MAIMGDCSPYLPRLVDDSSQFIGCFTNIFCWRYNHELLTLLELTDYLGSSSSFREEFLNASSCRQQVWLLAGLVPDLLPTEKMPGQSATINSTSLIYGASN